MLNIDKSKHFGESIQRTTSSKNIGQDTWSNHQDGYLHKQYTNSKETVNNIMNLPLLVDDKQCTKRPLKKLSVQNTRSYKTQMDSIEIANRIRESKIEEASEKMRIQEMLYSETDSDGSSKKKDSTDTQEPENQDSFEIHRRHTQRKSVADNFIYSQNKIIKSSKLNKQKSVQQSQSQLKSLKKPVMAYTQLRFRVFIMDEYYRKRYFKYESFSFQIDAVLNSYFETIKINTPFDLDSIIIITKKELNMDFDIEMVIESSSERKGYIKPGFTQIVLRMDNSLETPKTFKKLILASIYEVQDSDEDSMFQIDDNIDESPIHEKLRHLEESIQGPGKRKEYMNNEMSVPFIVESPIRQTDHVQYMTSFRLNEQLCETPIEQVFEPNQTTGLLDIFPKVNSTFEIESPDESFDSEKTNILDIAVVQEKSDVISRDSMGELHQASTNYTSQSPQIFVRPQVVTKLSCSDHSTPKNPALTPLKMQPQRYLKQNELLQSLSRQIERSSIKAQEQSLTQTLYSQ